MPIPIPIRDGLGRVDSMPAPAVPTPSVTWVHLFLTSKYTHGPWQNWGLDGAMDYDRKSDMTGSKVSLRMFLIACLALGCIGGVAGRAYLLAPRLQLGNAQRGHL